MVILIRLNFKFVQLRNGSEPHSNFLIIFVFFLKNSVRFDRTELQNELNMMHSSDEDIELCSVDRFGSIEPNFIQKNTKIIKKFVKVRVRFAVTKSN